MNRIENGICATKWFVYRAMQNFSDTLQPMGEKCLKCILTYLDSTKYNEINIGHSHIQNHLSYKNDIKRTNIMCTDSR